MIDRPVSAHRPRIVALGGNAPAPLHATLTLRGKDTPRWELRADSTALDIGLLTGSAATSTPLAFDLRGDGVVGDAAATGVEEGDAILEGGDQRREVGDGHPGGGGEAVEIGDEAGGVDAHGGVGPEGRQHVRLERA